MASASDADLPFRRACAYDGTTDAACRAPALVTSFPASEHVIPVIFPVSACVMPSFRHRSMVAIMSGFSLVKSLNSSV